MISHYGKLVGHQYLVDTVGPAIKEIVSDSQSVEVFIFWLLLVTYMGSILILVTGWSNENEKWWWCYC